MIEVKEEPTEEGGEHFRKRHEVSSVSRANDRCVSQVLLTGPEGE